MPRLGPWVGVGDDLAQEDFQGAVSGGGGGFNAPPVKPAPPAGPSGNGGSSTPPDPDGLFLVWDQDTTLTWDGDTLDWSE